MTVKLSQENYEKLKAIFESYNRFCEFNNQPSTLQIDEIIELFNEFTDKKLRKILVEYLKLIRFQQGDSFENHFATKEEKKHFWKTDSGLYLGRYHSKITGFEIIATADKLTSSEVEASDFDIEKVKIFDEEFE